MEPYEECVGQCKAAVESLRAVVQQAKSHRAKCCQVLAAALAASLAFEHALHSGELSSGQAQRLHKLCALTLAAVELAHQRVQVSNLPNISCHLSCQHCSLHETYTNDMTLMPLCKIHLIRLSALRSGQESLNLTCIDTPIHLQCMLIYQQRSCC